MAWLVVALLTLAAVRTEAAGFSDDFSRSPELAGWQIAGDASLFRWNATNQNLEVTWDSSRSNSYWYRPLGTILSREDDFSLTFDLRMEDVVIGVNPEKELTFELAIGFLNVASATRPEWRRGVGRNATHGPRNLVEFDYFPDSGYGATISPTLVSSNNQFATGFNFPLELDRGALFHVTLAYDGSRRALSTTIRRNGEVFGPVADVVLGGLFSDFRCDAVAVASYSDDLADGSLLAHGVVDNLVVSLPPPPVTGLTGGFTNSAWQAQFTSRSNWLYTLERSADCRGWAAAAPATPGTGGQMALSDSTPATTAAAFYRVRAEKP